MAEKKTSMMKRLLDKYKNQMMPVKSCQLKVAMDGTIVLTNRQADVITYTGVDAKGTVVTYDPEFILDFPVYMIERQFKQIKVNDVVLIREGAQAMYGKVLKISKDNLTVLAFDGTTITLNSKKDFLTKNETIPVAINMMSDNFGGINPMMLMLMSNDSGKFDIETLLMMQMMNGGNKEGNGLNFDNNTLMTMMLLGSKDGGKFDMETLLMMQMMNSNSGFNLFGNVTTPVCPDVEEQNKPKAPEKKEQQKNTSTKTE